ncbi:MAG: hypothetical protein IPK19_15415 [Chloroflexi bacterium]|nr:hypothetical protein [Chloroflexota bacterium]
MTLLRRAGRWIGRALTILSGVYAIVILLYFGLRLTVGESFDPVALANSLMPALLIPGLVLLALMLLGRRWLIAGLLLPGAAFFLLSYGGRFVPPAMRASADSSSDVQLRVLTYNLQSKTANFEPMIAIIREANADVVALQELLTGGQPGLRRGAGRPLPLSHPAAQRQLRPRHGHHEQVPADR